MFGLGIVVAGLLYMSATPASAALECHAKTSPRINVRPTKSRIKYDFTKSKAQLNSVNVDTISPYGPRHKTSVSGLMSGSIQLKSNISFLHETQPYSGRGCVYLKAVNVRIHVEPTIFIAREFPKDGCMHTAILAHEFKHVEVDQRIVNKYINRIGTAITKFVDLKGHEYGPIRAERMSGLQAEVGNELNAVVREMNDLMNEERREKQQAIDNLEEYEAIGTRCKSVNKPRRR